MGKHLTWDERLTIERMILKGYPVSQIADAVGKCKRTIYYELKRSRYQHLDHRTWKYEDRYNPDGAQRRYEENLKHKGAKAKVTKDADLRADIRRLIVEKKYSPQAALFAISKNGKHYNVEIRSVNTIYKAIRHGYIDGLTMSACPLGGRKKLKKDRIQRAKAPIRGTSIERRDESVLKRMDFGHWEMDSVKGMQKDHKVLLVLTERKTRYEVIESLTDHTAREVVLALARIRRRFKDNYKDIFKTITCDNGREFAYQSKIEEVLAPVYYCHPYSPFERGSNENQNRLIRRWCPKGASLEGITRKDARSIEEWMNDYPRALFSGGTAKEQFDREVANCTS